MVCSALGRSEPRERPVANTQVDVRDIGWMNGTFKPDLLNWSYGKRRWLSGVSVADKRKLFDRNLRFFNRPREHPPV
jgi:hypothetical protein